METRASKSWPDNGERSCLQPRQVKLQGPHWGKEWEPEGEKKGVPTEKLSLLSPWNCGKEPLRIRGVSATGGVMLLEREREWGWGSWSQALPRTEHLLCSQRRKPAKLVNKGKRPEGRQLGDKACDH